MSQSQFTETSGRRNEKLEKYQGVKEQLNKICGEKASVVPLMIGALRDNPQAGRVAPIMSERSVQKITQALRLLVGDSSLTETQDCSVRMNGEFINY